jgi:hypothetical protein
MADSVSPVELSEMSWKFFLNACSILSDILFAGIDLMTVQALMAMVNTSVLPVSLVLTVY